MAYLLDTNVLVRLSNRTDPDCLVALSAVARLELRGKSLHVCSQNLIEYRNVATRPIGGNGLGLSSAHVQLASYGFEGTFTLLKATDQIFPAWKNIIATLGIIGKRVHDARLVAVCHVHNVSHLLTFNVGDFTGMAGFGPGLSVVHPVNA